uniref:Coiled-coil serine rich protein 2 n=1 Tax=Chinchilla lanigera TaxID=34839 RepID=A0A8C2UMP1_CHILA
MSIAAALELIGRSQFLKTYKRTTWHDGSGSLHDVQLSLPPSPEPEEADETYKNEDLLNEIKQLKDEIKRKDEKIQLLEHQLATRCKCHQKSQEEKGTYADKYTQTPWRRIPPQVLQPSSSLPRPTDHAQGKLTKPPHTEARSECAAQGLRQDSAHPDGSCSRSSQQENSSGLEDWPFPSRPQFAVDVAKSTPCEVNLNMAMNAPEPSHLEKNQSNDTQFVPSLQTPAQSSTEDQASGIGRHQSLWVGCPSQPKSLQLLKSSILSSLASPPDSESSPSNTPASKKSLIVTPCNSPKLQPTSGQASVTNLNLKASKLRLPSTSFKQKQVGNPSPRPEPQNLQAKTSIPRPLARQKEIMQNPNGHLHSGDCLASNRCSRLPKPKIH